ncbi:MAG: hypothetical protein ACKD6O_07205 [Candidatus Bathyarchaeota archaeon]
MPVLKHACEGGGSISGIETEKGMHRKSRVDDGACNGCDAECVDA